MAHFCNKCKYWEKIVPQISGDTFGICNSSDVSLKVALDGKTHLNESGTLWTHAYWGCISFRDSGGCLLNVVEMIK
jgi:hypothetical protein